MLSLWFLILTFWVVVVSCCMSILDCFSIKHYLIKHICYSSNRQEVIQCLSISDSRQMSRILAWPRRIIKSYKDKIQIKFISCMSYISKINLIAAWINIQHAQGVARNRLIHLLPHNINSTNPDNPELSGNLFLCTIIFEVNFTESTKFIHSNETIILK